MLIKIHCTMARLSFEVTENAKSYVCIYLSLKLNISKTKSRCSITVETLEDTILNKMNEILVKAALIVVEVIALKWPIRSYFHNSPLRGSCLNGKFEILRKKEK